MKGFTNSNADSLSKENMADYIDFLNGDLRDLVGVYESIIGHLQWAPAERRAQLIDMAEKLKEHAKAIGAMLADDKFKLIQMPNDPEI